MLVACGMTLGGFAGGMLSHLGGPLLMVMGGTVFLTGVNWLARHVESRRANGRR